MNSTNNIRFSRVSRVSHPRATLLGTILLVVVFLGFGVWAQAHVIPEQSDNPQHTPSALHISAGDRHVAKS